MNDNKKFRLSAAAMSMAALLGGLRPQKVTKVFAKLTEHDVKLCADAAKITRLSHMQVCEVCNTAKFLQERGQFYSEGYASLLIAGVPGPLAEKLTFMPPGAKFDPSATVENAIKNEVLV